MHGWQVMDRTSYQVTPYSQMATTTCASRRKQLKKRNAPTERAICVQRMRLMRLMWLSLLLPILHTCSKRRRLKKARKEALLMRFL